jgi:excisionase family DNA binding protein
VILNADNSYTVATLAEKIQKSRRTIYRAIRNGRLHPTKVGERELRIPFEEANRWAGEGAPVNPLTRESE